MGMRSPLLIGVSFGQVPGQVFTKNGLKGVNYEKYKSVSFLYPIDYQQKKSYGIPLETLIIRGSLDHAQVGPQPKGNIIKGLCC